MKDINPKKVLIFSGNMGIGNLIMFIPTIKAFRDYFPKALFFLVTERSHLIPFKEILDQFHLIDEFIVFDGMKASLKERIKYMARVRNEQFDMVIKNFLVGCNFMTGLLKVKYRIGHISSPGFPIRGDFIFNYPAQMGEGEHEILRNLRLFYAIGGEKQEFQGLPFQLQIHKTIQQKVDYIIQNPTIAMQIGTSAIGGWKEWSILKFGELANRLISQYGVRVILLGSEKAKTKGEIVEKFIGKSHGLINLIGKTSILEAAAIIKKCKVLVSNDAGLVWVAQAVRTPVVVIYGPTDYLRTGPVGKRDKIIRKNLLCSPCYKSPADYKKPIRCKNKECLASITPQEVLNAITEFL